MSTQNFDAWDDFEPAEYASRNFGRLLAEDRIIIRAVIEGFKANKFKNIKQAADVGAGPNFYPAMLLASIMQDDGHIDLLEYSRPNRDFMNALLGNSDGIYTGKDKNGKTVVFDTRKQWHAFNEFIAEVGEEDRFRDTFAKAKRMAKSIEGNVYALPKAGYDFVSAYFVPESITTSKAECVKGITSLVESVRPGGGFMIAMVVGSRGWYAGETTHFPAVSVSTEEIRDIFNAIPYTTSTVTPAHDKHEKFRSGYHGMAVIVGKRT